MPKLLTQGVSSEPETGRSLIGIVAGFKSERWPDFDRNGGRLQIGIRRFVRRHSFSLSFPRILARSFTLGCSQSLWVVGLSASAHRYVGFTLK